MILCPDAENLLTVSPKEYFLKSCQIKLSISKVIADNKH